MTDKREQLPFKPNSPGTEDGEDFALLEPEISLLLSRKVSHRLDMVVVHLKHARE